MKISSHTIVRNEERYVWYSVMSVIEHVDKAYVWDTGSSDNTVKIVNEIKKIYPDKIDFRQVGKVTNESFTNVRQQMLDNDKGDWVIVVDGDEVWWKDSISGLTKIIKQSGDKLDSIVSCYLNVIGDIYHHQEEAAGMYKIDGKKGHLTIRAMNRNISGLHTAKPHGLQGYFNSKGELVQNLPKHRREFVDEPAYLHFTHMLRSSGLQKDKLVPKRDIKFKYELGESFPLDFYYPEVFFLPRPQVVESPWKVMEVDYYLSSIFQTPLRKLKRRLFKSRTGY